MNVKGADENRGTSGIHVPRSRQWRVPRQGIPQGKQITDRGGRGIVADGGRGIVADGGIEGTGEREGREECHTA
jgi:hypothetical protein